MSGEGQVDADAFPTTCDSRANPVARRLPDGEGVQQPPPLHHQPYDARTADPLVPRVSTSNSTTVKYSRIPVIVC